MRICGNIISFRNMGERVCTCTEYFVDMIWNNSVCYLLILDLNNFKNLTMRILDRIHFGKHSSLLPHQPSPIPYVVPLTRRISVRTSGCLLCRFYSSTIPKCSNVSGKRQANKKSVSTLTGKDNQSNQLHTTKSSYSTKSKTFDWLATWENR